MYSLQHYRFLNCQQGFLRVTPREQVCQHITDSVFYNCRHVRGSWAFMFSYCSLKRLRTSSFQLSCDWHLWTYRPFTSFYHATSTEPRQNRKPCGQLSSLASKTHHRTAFSKLMNLFWDLLNFIQKYIDRTLSGTWQAHWAWTCFTNLIR